MAQISEVIRERVTFTVGPDTTVFDAARLMTEHHIGAVPVLRDGKLLGIFSERTSRDSGLTAAMLEQTERELALAIDELRQVAHGIHPAALTRFGLRKAIEDLAARSPIAIDVRELPPQRLDPATEATAYYVIFPPAAKYLLGLGQDFRLLLKADDYFDFIILLMLGMGFVAQMPAITYVLSRMGLVTARWMLKH